MPESQLTLQDRVPKVSRKVRTCTECRRQKVKCIVQADRQTCTRCERNSLACRFNKSLQTILEEDTEVKTNLQNRLSRIEKVLHDIVEKNNHETPIISSHDANGSDRISASGLLAHPQNVNSGFMTSGQINVDSDQRNHVSFGGVVNHEFQLTSDTRNTQISENNSQNQLSTEPIRSLYEVTKRQSFQRDSDAEESANNSSVPENADGDIITNGIISAHEAQELFDYFMTSLNHYLWVGLDNENTTLESIRCASKLLALAILTATAMHMPNRTATYDLCYREFTTLVAKSIFSNENTLEDVRALCIAAFWLPDLSWKLSGQAVRLATELELHTAFFKNPETNETHQKARMWYMLYVCDHHFAIAYGRPPMVQTSLQIREHERFLESPYADSVDFRLLSQVALFSKFILMHESLCENASKLTVSEVATMVREYNIQLDQWRLLWEPRQLYNKFIGTFPPQGNVLYYQFAKLQLNVLAIRYMSSSRTDDRNLLDLRKKEFVNIAATAAFNILDLLLEDPWMRKALVGVPLFVHTMLTFACLFLFKLGTQWNRFFLGVGFAMDLNSLCHLIGRVVHCIRTSTAGERHIVHHIAVGLDKMIAKCRELHASRHATRQSSPATGPDTPGPGGIELRQHHEQQQQPQVIFENSQGNFFPGASINTSLPGAAAPSSAVFPHASGIGSGQNPHAVQLEDVMGDADLLDMIGSLGGTGNMFPFDEVNFWTEDM